MKFWANYIGLSSWNIIRVSSHLVILHLIRGIRWCAGILDLIRSHRGGRPPPISPHFRHWPSVTATFSPTVFLPICQLYFSQFVNCISPSLSTVFLQVCELYFSRFANCISPGLSTIFLSLLNHISCICLHELSSVLTVCQGTGGSFCHPQERKEGWNGDKWANAGNVHWRLLFLAP